ncbi:MAG: Gfo/Idh/MocA family oxidoreductase [Caldilineaceae bacterium SB0668_bin_21]|nr:Gfo/Idh/MocA family oxidoreductase [Caldilineaceae bacterium SB0668_bin_21]MYC23585.1 Gfo/Idh/MocA family oxidoreductase [Caldilineaceae bacterium SB0662_bin_25]
MPRKLKLALIGLGRRGRGGHLPIYPKLKDVFEFVAVCDKEEEVLREVAAEYGVNTYTSVRDLVAGEDLDIVDVVVPGEAHHPICCYLAEHGINIIVETPVAVTRPMTDMMIEAAERNNVKLEVAENYHRVPMARFQAKVIDSGIIGEVGRIYRIFYEGGYHGMSMLRLLANSPPKSILGITHVTDVVPIIDRMKRHHSQENCTTSFLEFENGAAATMIYSNVIHARSLGRKMVGISQIDGTRGAIVGETVYFTDPATYQSGASGVPYEPQRAFIEVEGRQILESISLQLPDQEIVWQNPYAHLGVGENNGRGVDMADQFMSIANAVLHDIEPTYGVQEARLDQEMTLAASESALMNKQPLDFPLRSPSKAEEQIQERFKETYGYAYTDIEPLLDVFYPRR